MQVHFHMVRATIHLTSRDFHFDKEKYKKFAKTNFTHIDPQAQRAGGSRRWVADEGSEHRGIGKVLRGGQVKDVNRIGYPCQSLLPSCLYRSLDGQIYIYLCKAMPFHTM